MMLSLQSDARQQPSASALSLGKAQLVLGSSAGASGSSTLSFTRNIFVGGGDRLEDPVLSLQPIDVYNDIKPLQLVNQLDGLFFFCFVIF